MTAANIIPEAPFEGDWRHDSMVQIIKQTAGFMSNPRQAEYWRGLAACVRPVEVVSAYDVWSKERVNLLKKAVKPKVKECYRVASLLCLQEDVLYVEGQMWAYAFGVDHAFNYVPSKGVYVDFTAEFALRKKPSEEAYVLFRKFDSDQLWNIVSHNGYYGNIYNEVYMRETGMISV